MGDVIDLTICILKDANGTHQRGLISSLYDYLYVMIVYQK